MDGYPIIIAMIIMATVTNSSNSEPTDRQAGAANGCHHRPPAPVRSEEKTMALTLTLDQANLLLRKLGFDAEFRATLARNLLREDRSAVLDVLAELRARGFVDAAALRGIKREITEKSQAAESDCYSDDGKGTVLDPVKLGQLQESCRLALWQADREALESAAVKALAGGAQ